MTSEYISKLVREQLDRVDDQNVREQIAKLAVIPYLEKRDWDYGLPETKFDCWIVLKHPESNTGIAYCSEGFGPKNPWGLIFLTGPQTNIGMDCSWFESLETAFLDSFAFDPSSGIPPITAVKD